MSITQWILSIALLAWALCATSAPARSPAARSSCPLVIVVAAASYFLFPLPTAGNDLDLVVAFGLVGVLFGLAASAVTRLHHRDGRLVATAGAGFAALWLVMIGGRIAFAEWANGSGARTVGMFSRDHGITGADAWTAAFVVMALGMVLARTVALAVRARRTSARSRASDRLNPVRNDHQENTMSLNPVAPAAPAGLAPHAPDRSGRSSP